MRVTIVVDDNLVLVQGQPETVDCSGLLSQNVHAVQWYDTWGEVEYATELQTGIRRANARITDFSAFQTYLDTWESAAQKPAAKAPSTSTANSG